MNLGKAARVGRMPMKRFVRQQDVDLREVRGVGRMTMQGISNRKDLRLRERGRVGSVPVERVGDWQDMDLAEGGGIGRMSVQGASNNKGRAAGLILGKDTEARNQIFLCAVFVNDPEARDQNGPGHYDISGRGST